MNSNVTVAVIGAGVAGVTAAKSALDEGLSVTCFEQDDQIGKGVMILNYTIKLFHFVDQIKQFFCEFKFFSYKFTCFCCSCFLMFLADIYTCPIYMFY